MIRARTLVNFLFAAIAFSIWFIPLSTTDSSEHSDFPAYYTGAREFLQGRSNQWYSLENQDRAGEKIFQKGLFRAAFEPPPAMVLMSPISLFKPSSAQVVFSILIIFCLAASAVILADALRLRAPVFISILTMFGPLFEVIKISKTAAFYLCALCLTIFLFERSGNQKKTEIKAGVASSLFIFKPHLLLPFLIYAAGSGRWTFIFSCLGAMTVIAILTFPFCGLQTYLNFVSFMGFLNTHPEVPGTIAMPVLKGQLLLFSVSAHDATLISTLVFVMLLPLIFYLGHRNKALSNWWRAASIATFIFMLPFISYFQLYDFTVAIPALCFLLLDLWKQKNKVHLTLCCVSLLLFMQPIYTFIHYCYLLQRLGDINIHFVGLLILSFVSLIWLFSCRKEEITDSNNAQEV